MNLLARKALLLALAASFFLMCEDPGEIGIGESLPNSSEVRFIDLPLDPKTFYTDSVNSKNNRLMFGSYDDPVFGRVTSTAYMEMLISDPNFIYPDEADLDSIVLFLDIDYQYTTSVTPLVFLEARTFDGNIEDRLYYTKDSIQTVGVDKISLLGSSIFDYDPTSNRAWGFKLLDGIGNQILNGILNDRDSVFRQQEKFREFFTGIKLVSTDGSNGVVGFDPASDSTRMVLYFHYEDLPGIIVHRQHRFGVRTGFNNIYSDFSGTRFDGNLTPFTDIDADPDFAFHDPALGFYLKADLTSLLNFRDTANAVVNRADLIIKLDKTFTDFSPPQEIKFYQLNSNNRFVISDYSYIPRSIQFENPDILFNPTYADFPFDFAYDSTNYLYSEQVTFYVNNVLKESLSDTTLLVLPNAPLRDATRTDSTYYPRTNSVDRFVVPKDGVKLRVYYSKFE